MMPEKEGDVRREKKKHAGIHHLVAERWNRSSQTSLVPMGREADCPSEFL